VSSSSWSTILTFSLSSLQQKIRLKYKRSNSSCQMVQYMKECHTFRMSAQVRGCVLCPVSCCQLLQRTSCIIYGGSSFCHFLLFLLPSYESR
jgi:hypothetical protein